MAFTVRPYLYVASGKLAEEFHKGFAIDAGNAFFDDVCWISPREFNARIGGHDDDIA